MKNHNEFMITLTGLVLYVITKDENEITCISLDFDEVVKIDSKTGKCNCIESYMNTSTNQKEMYNTDNTIHKTKENAKQLL